MATTGVINGTDLLMYSDGNPIAYSTSCSLGFTQNTIETTNKDTRSQETFIAGRRGGTISCDGFVALDSEYNYSYMYGIMITQSLVTLMFATTDTEDKYYQVQALMTDISLESPDNDNSSFSVSFRTVGTPTEVAGSGILSFVSAEITDSSPDVAILTFSSPLANVVPDVSAIALTKNSAPYTNFTLSIVGGNLHITMVDDVVDGDVLSVTYTRPGSSFLQDAGGNGADSFTSAIVNNVGLAPFSNDLLARYNTRSELNITDSVGGDPASILMPVFIGGGTAHYSIPITNLGTSHTIRFMAGAAGANATRICAYETTNNVSLLTENVIYRVNSVNHTFPIDTSATFYDVTIIRSGEDITLNVNGVETTHTIDAVNNVDFQVQHIGRFGTFYAQGIISYISFNDYEFVLNGNSYVFDTGALGSTLRLAMQTGSAVNRGYSKHGYSKAIDVGFTRYVHSINPVGNKDIDIPFISAGIEKDNPNFDTPYYVKGISRSGEASSHNLTDSKIRFTDDFFDRSNTTIWNNDCRLSDDYDVVNTKDFHINSLNFKTLIGWLNNGYAGRLFPKVLVNSINDREYLQEILLYTTDKSGQNEVDILTYTGDITEAVTDDGEYVFDAGTNYVLIND